MISIDGSSSGSNPGSTDTVFLLEFPDMDRAELLKQLDEKLTLYGMCLEIDDAHSPWPDDDGGEMRVLVCLRAVLPHLDAEGLAVAGKALLEG